MKKYSFKIFLGVLICILFSACDLKDKKTTITVKDPERHYYPILRGQDLEVLYEIENTGDNPLFINNILTSCGCVLVDESSFKRLPPKGKGFIRLKYNSGKNIGYVKHHIMIYANFESGKKEEVTFDVNVVPNALYTRDYEELHKEYTEKHEKEKLLVDGYENNLGYYIGEEGW